MMNYKMLPKYCWHKTLECTVEVIKTGCFPTSVIVKLPDEREIDTDIQDLQLPQNGH